MDEAGDFSPLTVPLLVRTPVDDSRFAGRRLAGLMVALSQLLNSEEVRHFESNM